MILELVGPAGVGKSSLASHLCSTHSAFQRARRLSVKAPLGAAFLLTHGWGLLQILLRCRGSDRWFTWYESKWLAYLDGWHRVLQQQASDSARIIVIDQGPVFYLATFRVFGPSMLRSDRLQDWWEAKFRRWSSVLDLIVWLDSPDGVLLDRIRSRPKQHLVKQKSEPEMLDFLARYRAGISQVLANLSSCGPVETLQVDTDRHTLDEIESLVVARTTTL